ncbi:MAG: F0F1 ATP synthase subunit A [Flavobacteriales bacterium]|nr:F0F1 ATP synthase subunit A [Flavobacteriales bacterium]
MQRKTTIKLAIALVMSTLFTANFYAQSEPTEHPEQTEEKYDPVATALGHALDSHEIHFLGEGESAVHLPLPVILYTDNGLEFFMSSEFHHGEHAHIERDGKKVDGYVYKNYFIDHHMTKISPVIDSHGHYTIDEEVSITDFSITKNVFALFITAFLLLFVFMKVGKFYKKNGAVAPKGLTSWMEPLILFVRDDIAEPNLGDKKTKFMPYLLTVFFFIWFGNLLGLIPFISNPNLTGNISFTIVLALFTLIVQMLFSKKGFWKHIFSPPGVPVALYPILIPIEFAGIFIKPAALLIRLFANITAGHIIVVSLVGIIFVKGSLAWSGLSVPMTLFISCLELLVAFLQAYIFTMLSALFIGTAIDDGHH